ncbi:MAG: TrmH family RNA methyltransferase [Phycisphaerae bacterium]
MSAAYPKYRKSLDFSYTFGVAPTIELMTCRPGRARRIFVRRPDRGRNGIGRLLELADKAGVPVDQAERAIERISSKPFPAVGVFEKFPSALKAWTSHVVLVSPRYAGNVGTIIRTMVGFGLADLAVCSTCPELLGPQVVRASMGAIFRVRWGVFETLDTYCRQYPGQRLYCLAPDGEKQIASLHPNGPFALVFGSEGSGLDARARQDRTTVRIDQSGLVDSLNLSVAAGIALYAVTQAGTK